VQNNKQLLSTLTRKTFDKNVESYRIPDPATKHNARWTNEELLLGVQGKNSKRFKSLKTLSLSFCLKLFDSPETLLKTLCSKKITQNPLKFESFKNNRSTFIALLVTLIRKNIHLKRINSKGFA
jgi:hypothetical protein